VTVAGLLVVFVGLALAANYLWKWARSESWQESFMCLVCALLSLLFAVAGLLLVDE
jgi:hypothetical protein